MTRMNRAAALLLAATAAACTTDAHANEQAAAIAPASAGAPFAHHPSAGHTAAVTDPSGAALSADAGPAPREMVVTASDFRFDAPAAVPAGRTTIRLVNHGPELHHVQLVRIAAGHTVKDFTDRLAAHDLAPSWVTYVGGPNAPVPGGEASATVDLAPGQYAIVCLIPSPDGVPHVMKGMAKAFTVTRAGRPATEPRADVRMTLTDYAFGLSSPIAAGRRTIRVENRVAQPHEVLLVQLAPGRTMEEVAAWVDKQQGPPPGRPIGGSTLLAHGQVDFVTADFAPGEYALLCFVPDAHDGKRHVMHGMMRQITVR